LIKACRAILEEKRRNFTGVNEWEVRIEAWLLGLENESIDSAIENDNGVMNG